MWVAMKLNQVPEVSGGNGPATHPAQRDARRHGRAVGGCNSRDTSRESRASAAQSSMGLYAKVPSAGAGATRCALLGHTQLSTTTSVLSV